MTLAVPFLKARIKWQEHSVCCCDNCAHTQDPVGIRQAAVISGRDFCLCDECALSFKQNVYKLSVVTGFSYC